MGDHVVGGERVDGGVEGGARRNRDGYPRTSGAATGGQRPNEQNAECGMGNEEPMRNAEFGMRNCRTTSIPTCLQRGSTFARAIPPSAFGIPHSVHSAFRIVTTRSPVSHPDSAAAAPSPRAHPRRPCGPWSTRDRKSTRLNSSHSQISYAVFCLKKKKPLAYARNL